MYERRNEDVERRSILRKEDIKDILQTGIIKDKIIEWDDWGHIKKAWLKEVSNSSLPSIETRSLDRVYFKDSEISGFIGCSLNQTSIVNCDVSRIERCSLYGAYINRTKIGCLTLNNLANSCFLRCEWKGFGENNTWTSCSLDQNDVKPWDSSLHCSVKIWEPKSPECSARYSPLHFIKNQLNRMQAYKIVNQNLKGFFFPEGFMNKGDTGIHYKPQTSVSVEDYDTDVAEDCGKGIHLGFEQYVLNFVDLQHFYHPGRKYKIMLVSFDPKDVVCTPLVKGKFRVKKCYVERELSKEEFLERC